MKTFSEADLVAALADGAIVVLAEANWDRLSDRFRVVDRHDTGLAGSLLLVKRPCPAERAPGWAVVEQPRAGERVVRPLPDEAEARALIADRLAAYERMWDG